jgi:hypothetical protein
LTLASTLAFLFLLLLLKLQLGLSRHLSTLLLLNCLDLFCHSIAVDLSL